MPWEALIYLALLLVPMAIVAVHLHRHAGEPGGSLSAFRDGVAVVEVALDEAAASELCKRAVLEVNETRTLSKLKRHRLDVKSHIEGEMAGSQFLRFEFAPADAGRTRITVHAPVTGNPGSYLSGIRLSVTRKRRALLDRLARFLATEGNGRVLNSS